MFLKFSTALMKSPSSIWNSACPSFEDMVRPMSFRSQKPSPFTSRQTAALPSLSWESSPWSTAMTLKGCPVSGMLFLTLPLFVFSTTSCPPRSPASTSPRRSERLPSGSLPAITAETAQAKTAAQKNRALCGIAVSQKTGSRQLSGNKFPNTFCHIPAF